MGLTIALMVLWGVLGIANLCQEKVTKVSYACTWIVLMAFLASKLIETI